MTTPVVSIDEHRTDARPRRRRWRSLLVILGALIITAAIWVVWFSSLFAIRSASVVGVTGAPAQAVASAAQVPIGLPLAQLEADAITERISAIPWVASVEVRRGWPNAVVLAVTPRTPVAKVAGSDEVVDANGVAFTPPVPVTAALLPIDATDVALAEAVKVVSGLPADLRARVTEVAATTRDDIELTLKSGAQVRWGSADQGAFKAEVLGALLQRRARMYDVTAPELPTTFAEKPKKGGSASGQ